MSTSEVSFDSNLKKVDNALQDVCNIPKMIPVEVKLKDINKNVKKVEKLSLANQNNSKKFVTEVMLKEEAELHDQNAEVDEELKRLAIKKWNEVDHDVRLTQLNHLLEKSSIYANYLLNVIEESEKKEKRKALKKEKRLQNKSIKNNKKVTINSISKKRSSDSAESHHVLKKRKLNKPLCDKKYAIGDRVMVCITQNDNEDLVEALIMDSCFESNAWKYEIKYGRNKTWVNESTILSECDEVKSCGSFSQSKLQPTLLLKKLDVNALLQSKLYNGCEENSYCSLEKGKKDFNGLEIPENQPELLTGGILREYQITGFQWLKVLFDNAVNGILADEMGLGKTIQSIAMVCRLIKIGFQGPFLVCAPLSTVSNWIIEFKKFAPQIPLLLYHGSAKERVVLAKHIGETTSALNCKPVVVTSYEVLMRDSSALSKFSWDYLIVDEGHRLKNTKCRLLKSLKSLNVTAKVLLTGTPLQNNLAELFSLLNFLLPEVFNDLSTFEAWFDLGEIQKRAKAISCEKEESVVVKLHKILAPFLLRRTKSDIELELPPKRELLVFVPLSSHQTNLYHAIADRTIRKLLHSKNEKEQILDVKEICKNDNDSVKAHIEKLTRSSTLASRLSMEKNEQLHDNDSIVNVSLNNLMVHMRKCCNHPYLIEFPLIPGTDYYKIDDEIVTSCGKMQLLDRMIPILLKNRHKVLIFSQLTKVLDILEDYCNLKSYNFFRLDGSTKCDDRQKFIDQFNNDPDSFLFLLSTRAGGLGINLTSADTVVIYDSDWNPQNDLQAQDRCHRIGQTRPVMVYRLVASNTVDQYMVQRAEAKRVLERSIINRNKFKGKLSDDLKSNTSNAVESTTLLAMLQKFNADGTSHTLPITDGELNKILDREIVMTCTDDDISCGIFQQFE